MTGLAAGMPDITIRPAATPDDFAEAARLMRLLVQWLRERFRDDIWAVDTYFDKDAYDAELASLATVYAPPAGAIVLAFVDGVAAGTVALQDSGWPTCEVKHLVVDPQFQRQGLGRRLMVALMNLARVRGYTAMRLDTSVKQHESVALYRSLGFGDIPIYKDTPHILHAFVVPLGREL